MNANRLVVSLQLFTTRQPDNAALPAPFSGYGNNPIKMTASTGSAARQQQFMWDAGDLPIGIYFCKVQTGQKSQVQKIMKVQ